MKKSIEIFKYVKNILLVIIEVIIISTLFVYYSNKIVSVNNIFEIIERGLLGFALYEIIIYTVLNTISDIKRDSYLSLKTTCENVVLFLESRDLRIQELILKNIVVQMDMSTFNTIEIRNEYKMLKKIIDKKDLNMARIELIRINHCFEKESLQWNFTLFVRWFK